MLAEQDLVSFWFYYCKCKTHKRGLQDFDNTAKTTQGSSNQVQHGLHTKTEQDYLEVVGTIFGLACMVVEANSP